MKSIEELRKVLKRCTSKAGIEPNRFDTYWITANACDHLIDEIEAEIERDYMRLPRDADNEPIHVGDEIQFRNDSPITVDSIGTSRVYESDWGFFGSNGGFYGQGTMKNVRHVKPDPLKELLNDHLQEREKIGRKLESSLITLGEAESEEDACDKLFAERIRKLLGGDE